MKDSAMAARIDAMLDAEEAAWDGAGPPRAGTLHEFRRHRRPPRPVTVNFSGGITQTCWSVTRTNGSYRVIYLPSAGYFSLCVESDFGPLDIGVHGPAIDCFGSV